MELKQIFFSEKTRISGSTQRLPGFIFVALFFGLAIFLAVFAFMDTFHWEFIAAALVLGILGYLRLLMTMKLQRIDVDEQTIYIQNRNNTFEISYAEVYAGNKPLLRFNGMSAIKLYYTNAQDEKKTIRFVPRQFGDHYENFIDLLYQKKPDIKYKTSLF